MSVFAQCAGVLLLSVLCPDLIGNCAQIVSLPNLQIIDFAYGHTGSTHDATAWEQTRLAKEHNTLLGGASGFGRTLPIQLVHPLEPVQN